MDLILNFFDKNLFTPHVYPITWTEDWWIRQYISLILIVTFASYLMYFGIAGLSYLFIFDKKLRNHPKFLKNQEILEIGVTVKTIPVISLITNVIFLFEVRGYSKLYDNVHDSPYGWLSIIMNGIFFIFFTDMLIYWIHRGLHHKLFYKRFHKLHHKWIIPTPFASHAFHPLDGFSQSLPYHIYVFLFPFHKLEYLCLFIFVNIWTVSIHDADYRVINKLRPFINGSAHHIDHHYYFNYNYGQFFTLWDRIGGSFRYPSAFENQDPKSLILNQKENSEEKNE